MNGVHLRKYGVQATVDFEVYGIDGVDLKDDWVPAATDCEVMKDGGASTQCTNTATDEGVTFSIVLTATEMEAARLVVKVQDAAAKVILDTVVIIETYGHPSAQHAMDFDDGVRGGLTALPNAAAAAAGGLPVSAAGTLAMDTLADWVDGGRLDLLLDAIPTTAMRGTDFAALASAWTATRAGYVDELGPLNVPADVDALTATVGVSGAGLSDLGGMSTGMKAEVNAEVKDVLFTDTDAEPGQGTPAATTSLAAKLGYLYKAWRNKGDQNKTTGVQNLYNDAGAVVDQKATNADDGTTFTRGKMGTGA